MDRLDLPGLDAFASVARHGSFRAAATARGVTPSALSHSLRTLEAALGVRLLNRTSRSVRPTEAGARLLARLAPALGEIAEAVETVNDFRDTAIGTLRLNVPRIAAEMILAPLVGPFLAAHPGARLDIVTDDGFIDIVKEGFDAGIRAGERVPQDMIAIPIGPPRRFAVVASPGYVAVHGVPATPHELRRHACVCRIYPGGARLLWTFARGGEVLEVAVEGALAVDDVGLMIAGAIGGVGLAFVYEDLVAAPLAGGRLVRVLDDWCPIFPGFYLYHPSNRQMPRLLRAFIDAAKETLHGATRDPGKLAVR